MARVTAERAQMTKAGLLAAANDVLREQGYAGLTTRAVAAAAGAPMSQIQYHFGSKEGMVLALFEHMNSQLLDRQNAVGGSNGSQGIPRPAILPRPAQSRRSSHPQ